MDLRSYFLRLIRRWPVFVAVFLVVGAALAGAGLLLQKSYDSSVRMVFTANLTADTPVDTRQIADLYLTSRMKTYAELVTTNEVLQPVIDSLALDVSVSELVEQIEVTIPTGTTVVEVAVTAPSGAEAAATANRIAAQIPWAVANLENAAAIAQSPVKVEVLQPADIPETQSSPKVLLNLVVALGMAFIAGIFAALLVDNYDTRVRRRRDVTALGVPYLGGIPTVRKTNARDLLQFTKLAPEPRSTFHRVAIDLLYAVEATPKKLLFTSPRAGAGKTTVVANIAGALAEAGNRVVVIDADVRGGRLAARVGITQTRGITDFASGRIPFDDSMLQEKWGGFTVVPCGGSAVDVGEMLAGEKFGELMGRFADRFDVILVDAPPITDLSEASRFTQNVANVVVVVEAVSTRRAEIQRVTSSLRQAGANVVGVVLSRARKDEQSAPADEQVQDDDGTSDRSPVGQHHRHE